ncbi:protein of unknown function [Candidatus Hydrogenisulfobacillus filiaventi]|uniref:Uncharacterized protein n=1 Tax=Candidatus Hydrogenisulfobacillus filiaventi TaxID=2707344 RepID=A0A6F8ZIN9_9FIRM|nr:protein of unknown function [Candidatus Hydrogenisulfobacillus filiaventi]
MCGAEVGKRKGRALYMSWKPHELVVARHADWPRPLTPRWAGSLAPWRIWGAGTPRTATWPARSGLPAKPSHPNQESGG